MSVDVRELADSRGFDLNDRTGTATFHYYAKATGESNPENAVYVAVLADTNLAPYEWNGLSRGRPKAEALGNGWYDVSLPYSLPTGGVGSDPTAINPPGSPPTSAPPPSPTAEAPLTLETSLEIGGRPPMLFYSRATVSRTGARGVVMGPAAAPINIAAPDYRGAINVLSDGHVGGVEPTESGMTWSVERVFPRITRRYVYGLRENLWRTNTQAWQGYPMDTLLFLGAALHMQPDGKIKAQFKFALDFEDRGENGAGIEVRPGGQLTVPRRPPHHYLWVAFRTEYDATSGRIVEAPAAAYVERLYNRFNPQNFGLG